MRNTTILRIGIPFTFILLLATSCKTAKLSNSWQSDDFPQAKSKTILVAAKSSDKNTQATYEDALVNELKSKGVSAVAAHKKFPDLKDRKRTEEETDAILKSFKKEGIQGILVTSLANTITLTNKDEIAKRVDMPAIDYSKRSFFTFIGYNELKDLPRVDSNENNAQNIPELKSTVYVLEAVLYDISLDKEKQLVSTQTVEITDPTSGKKVRDAFVKIITKPFKE